MRASAQFADMRLDAAQELVARTALGATACITGPPRAGKTTALAAHFLRLAREGQQALVICSHECTVTAFRDALAALTDKVVVKSETIATASEHAAGWMRASYVAARVTPRLQVGDQRATRAIVQQAARGLLNMSWPLFARRQLNLDLPHLSRPDAFLDEAASLLTLLQRARIGPDEFEAGCSAGLAAFYGENVERAVVLVQDPLVRERASRRGRDACRAPATTLALQRVAERDVAAILAQLYREYLVAAAAADVRSPDDVMDAAVRWLSHDFHGAHEVMRPFAAIILDDAEDAEPGVAALVTALKKVSTCSLLVAGWDEARVGGFEGRRSALALGEGGVRIELAPRGPIPATRFERLANEAEELMWLARQMEGLLAEGEVPDEIALLCRAEDTAAAYVRQLRALGVHISMPPAAFENERELLDALSLAALVQDPFQPAQLLRILSSRLIGFSDATLWALCRDPSATAQLALPVGEPGLSSRAGTGRALTDNVLFGVADRLLSDPQRETLVRFREQLASWQATARNLCAAELLAYVTAAAGFSHYWAQAPEYQHARLVEDMGRMLEAINRADGDGELSLAAAAENFAQGTLWLRSARLAAGAIQSNSITGAKGRRWRHVFVCGVAHERFPRVYTSHAIAFSRTYGLIVRENVARGAAQTAKYAWYYAKFGAKNMYLGEERRALNYGLSRATVAAAASGYGLPPRWAREQDLLATLPDAIAETNRHAAAGSAAAPSSPPGNAQAEPQ